MNTRWGIYITLPALALGAGLLANHPTGAWAHPGHDDPHPSAAQARPAPAPAPAGAQSRPDWSQRGWSQPVGRPGWGQSDGRPGARPLPSSVRDPYTRVTGLAGEFDRVTEQLVDVMTREAHDQNDEKREESAEFRAIMAAGALSGQAHGFNMLLRRNDEADVRAGTAFLMRSVQMAQGVVVYGEITRDGRAAWSRVRTAASQLNAEVARLPRNWDRNRD